MALDTYAKLQTQVESWLHRANIKDTDGSDEVPTLIELGEKWLFRHARTHEMEATLSGTIDANGALAVPSDYAELKHARVSQSPSVPLKMRPSHWLYEQYPRSGATGVPQFMARDGASFVFGPHPSSTYDIVGVYYAKPTSIASSANALFLANPDLYLYAALAEAEAYVKNNVWVAAWQAKRAQLLADVNMETEQAQHGTGMRSAPDVVVE